MKHFELTSLSNKHSRMFKLAIILLVVNVLALKKGIAQDKLMVELKPSKELVINLQALMRKIKKNNYYTKNKFRWIIYVRQRVQQKDTGYIVLITVIDSMGPRTRKLSKGFFYLNDVLFLVTGDINAPMFKPIGEKNVKFEYFKSKNNSTNVNTCEDPTWIYYWNNGKIVLLQESFYY